MSAVDTCRQELEVTVPWEQIQQETERIVQSIRRAARIPGFRPGKAPDSVVKARYKNEIRQEIIEQLVPKYFWEEAKSKDLDVVGSPDVTDLQLEDGAPMRFRAEFEVMPEFELGEYRRIEIPYSEPEVTDEQVEGELEALREQHASYVNLDPRPLQDGDVAVLKLKSEPVADAPQIDEDDTTITLAEEGTLPEFTENLRGKSPGDTVDFSVTYPDDFGNEKLAGETIPFHAEIKGLRKKELPELDDDFAADLGDFRTIEEVRSYIREQIGESLRRQATEAAKEKLLDKLVAAHDFPVPESLVERQAARRVERQLSALQRQGVDIEKLDVDWREARDKQREAAERDVKGGLILERIAKVEDIKAGSEEIDQQVQLYARQTQQTVERARKKLAEEGTLDRIQSQITHEKILNFLFDEAEKVDEEPEAADSDS